MSAPCTLQLRRTVLAVSVLYDVDVEPGDDGITLAGTPALAVSWAECTTALAGVDPELAAGRERLARWLRARRWAADVAPDRLRAALRPAGLPVGHPLHPGEGWTRERVLGGALDLGLGGVGIDPAEPDRVVLLPISAVTDAGLDVARAWTDARRELERLGTLAAERLDRDPAGRLRPMGDCDVVTLLGARSLRTALAASGCGLGAAAVPMRRRGWTQLGLVDPAFVPAAAAASSDEDRGFSRPLLVTADEVVLARDGGRPSEIVLRDPAGTQPVLRDVLYR